MSEFIMQARYRSSYLQQLGQKKHMATRNIFYSNKIYAQWRSQPDSLVPLCKFQAIVVTNFLRN